VKVLTKAEEDLLDLERELARLKRHEKKLMFRRKRINTALTKLRPRLKRLAETVSEHKRALAARNG
jgi:regulator of replication initiation timing